MSNAQFNLKNPVHFMAVGFGSGLIKPAPGTWGSLLAMFLFLGIALLPIKVQIALIVVAAIAGCFICGKAALDSGEHDHSAIVWDEFVGYWIGALFLPYHIIWFFVAFLFFRFFDIVKPFPIGFVDKRVKGGVGIMIDDIIAGLFTMGSMYLVIEGYQLYLQYGVFQ